MPAPTEDRSATMHLFAIGLGLGDEVASRLPAELLRTARGFPHLDADTAWLRTPRRGVVACGVTSRPAMVAPREYVHDAPDTTVLYDGLPLAVGGGFDGHRASELARRWDRLDSELEGRFVCVRVGRESGEVELLTDPLGVAQLYVWEAAGASIVSNSAGLVARAIGTTEPDPLGVSMFLTMDWVGADRTLRRDVRVAPGGQHWTWGPGDARWRRRTYWSVAANTGAPVRRVDDAVVAEAVEELTVVTRAAADVTGSVFAPLTGGKDSRLLAAILMTAGIDAEYWTKGDAGSRDIEIAGEIAARYGLRHRFANRPTQPEDGRDPTRDVASEWPEITREFVLQTDGLASIFLVGNIQGQPARVPRLAVTFTAMCAESARGIHAHEYLSGRDTSVRRVRRYLPYSETQVPRGLVHAAAYARSRRQVREWVDAATGAGVPARNLGVAFYLDERCRRWAANNPRELAQTEDKVLPFMTRSYVRTALSLDPDERAANQLHRWVIRRLVPELELDPPPDKVWRTLEPPPGMRRRAYNALMASLPYAARRGIVMAREALRPTIVTRAPWSPYDEESWLEANLGHARDTMLSRAGSPLWAYLDRRTLERLLSPATPDGLRRLNQLPLFAAYTMFLFEEIEDGLARDPLPAWPGRPTIAAGAGAD